MPVWEMSEIADIDVGHAIHGNQKNLYRTVKLYLYENTIKKMVKESLRLSGITNGGKFMFSP